MRILDSKVEKGVINARLLIEYEDIIMAAGQQQAVQKAIAEMSESLGVGEVHYASVTEMTEKDSGDIEIAVEAAVSPEVKLGQYRGLVIKIGHNEDFEQAALKAAADNITVDIPELIIDRQLDDMEREAQNELLQSTSLHTLADIFSIVSRLSKQEKKNKTVDELWAQAMKASESYIAKDAQDVDLMVESIKEDCSLSEDTIFRAIVTRAQERSKLGAEEIAGQIFEAYLRTQSQNTQLWRESHRAEAISRCKTELMLNAVIKAEGIQADEEDFQNTASELALNYDMDVEQFLGIVGEEGIKNQLRRKQAIKLIVDSAKGL